MLFSELFYFAPLSHNDSVFHLHSSTEAPLFWEGLLLHKLTYVKED